MPACVIVIATMRVLPVISGCSSRLGPVTNFSSMALLYQAARLAFLQSGLVVVERRGPLLEISNCQIGPFFFWHTCCYSGIEAVKAVSGRGNPFG